MRHIIWDWNGTLLNDLPVILDSINATLPSVGMREITIDDYRSHYTRPVKHFYDMIAGTELDEATWTLIDQRFHGHYHASVHLAQLSEGAAALLREIDRSHHQQSLLSMAPHAELQVALSLFDVAHYFAVAQGNLGAPGGHKAEHLASHLAQVGSDPATVTLIGDTIDDANAAAENGVECVLYDDGSHHRQDLEATGLPIADSLADAVQLALGDWVPSVDGLPANP